MRIGRSFSYFYFGNNCLDGKIYKTKYYKLKAVLAMGCRVNLAQATRFRIRSERQSKLIENFNLD